MIVESDVALGHGGTLSKINPQQMDTPERSHAAAFGRLPCDELMQDDPQ